MRAALVLLCLSSLTLVTRAEAAPVSKDDPCLGRWIGHGKNTGIDGIWSIELNLVSGPTDGTCGTIEYDNPPCGGVLEQCERRGNEIHTKERYTHSKNCAPPGKVILECEGSVMKFAWVGWERVDTVLTRPTSEGTTPKPPTPPKPAPRDDDAADDDATDDDARADGDETTPKKSCLPACAVGHADDPALWWLALPALLALRRKRRRRGQSTPSSASLSQGSGASSAARPRTKSNRVRVRT